MAYEMVMPYHLHMPSYFLETFTEYPSESKELKEWLDRQLPFFCTILFCPFFNCFSTLTDIQWQQLFIWQTVCLLRVCPRFLAILI